MKLTASMLRKIIKEETSKVLEVSLMTPEEEIELDRAAREKSARRRAAGSGHKIRSKDAPGRSLADFEAYEIDRKKREENNRWSEISSKYPKISSKVGRAAFDKEMAARHEGALGGGGSYSGSSAEYKVLLDLLEENM